MSKELSAQARTEFEDEVKHQYDVADTGLVGTVRTKDISKAEDAYFPRFSKGAATLRSARGAEDDVTGMQVESDRVNLTLLDYEAPEYTDIFDQEKTNIDDKKELAKVIAGAMIRRKEQTIIDAFGAATYAANLNVRDTANNKYLAMDIAVNASGLTQNKIARAKALMKSRNVTGEFYAASNAEDLEDMLNNQILTSSDYNSVKALVDGEVNSWMGFKWNFIGVRPEGGLPYTDNGDDTATSVGYFYEKMSTGCIMNLNRVEVNYIPEKTSWLSNGLFQVGSRVIDPEGLIRYTALLDRSAA